MQKKKEVEDKIVQISAEFDRSVCYFNHASVFVQGKQVFVTPENKVDNSLTIHEYYGSTTTLWLKPQQRSACGDYYFAYFYDNHCETLVKFIVTLRRLLQVAEGRVRIVTNVKYCPEKIAFSMKYLHGTCGWTSSTNKHWTECNPGVEEMLHKKGIVIHESEGALVGVEVHGVLFVLERIERVSAREFESLLFNSGKYVGCTGDSSLSMALSSRRVPLYEVLDHKRAFAQQLERAWTETGGDKHSFDIMMLRQPLSPSGDTSYDAAALETQLDRFVEKLFERTTQHVLEEYLRLGVVCTSTNSI
eukprot:jgi/Antlo1/1158/2329